MEEEVEENEESSMNTSLTTQLKTYTRQNNKSSGLVTKLEILQDFDEITEEDLTNAENILNQETTGNTIETEKSNASYETVTELVDGSELPVKLPADITVVKEVAVTPVKRGRGRPKKNATPPHPVAIIQAFESFSCSLCPRSFQTAFGLKKHESACKRVHGITKEEVEEVPEEEEEAEVIKEVSPPVGKVTGKRKRGRPPKSEPLPEEITDESLSEEITKFKCELCPREFNTLPGLHRHEASCRKNPSGKHKVPAEDPDGYIPNVPIYNKQLNLNQILEGTLEGDQVAIEAVDVKDPYIFEEGRCHCCGEDIETAHMGGEFECTECQKLFRLKSSLERHRRVIHNEGDSYKCPECDARCPDKGTLARHMYTHTGLKPVSCPVCKTEFSRKYHLIRHNYQTGCDGSKRPTFPCQVCGRVFNRKDNLREHLRAHAGQTKRKKKYTCEECNQEFVGLQMLTMHRRSHIPGLLDGDKPWPCDFCSKQFPSQGALKKHRRKHTGERPYECSYCFARFAAKETLNRHLRTHTGVKPHTCQYCGKGFIQASQLRAHVFHHSDVPGFTGEGGFTCDLCGKSFNRKQRLQLHVKYVHEGAEPYRCHTCSRTFLRKEDLARHQLLHSGVKEHKCPICEKAFAMKSSLKIHLLTHTKEPPRSCDECGRAFIRQDCLLRHMRTKHRDMLEEIMQEAEKKKLQQQLLAAANQAALELPAEEPHVLTEANLADSVRELLTLLVDETTLKAFGWPDSSVDKLLEAVIRRCGHQPAGFPDMAYADRLRENAKLLFTVVIDDSAVKTLLNNQTVDEVILHVLRLAKS